MFWEKLLFDRKDYELLDLIKQIETARSGSDARRGILDPALHPHGIKGLLYTSEFRIAYAVINLLSSLSAGQAADRLAALRTLYDETLSSAHSTLRLNTARALVQIMKDLAARDDPEERIWFAHDFRRTATGAPRMVRRMLRRYHLLEMPEEWNQLVFDDHVHDVNTLGRKTPTRLVMDAWIKGIRSLGVIYCNHIARDAAEELITAAEIVGMKVRIGLDFSAAFRGRRVFFTWTPRGFADAGAFLDFLGRPPLSGLMRQGMEVTAWKRSRILHLLDQWNSGLRHSFAFAFAVRIPEVSREDLLRQVGAGQPSLMHLADCLHQSVAQALRPRAAALRAARTAEAARELRRIEAVTYDRVLRLLTTAEALLGDVGRPAPVLQGIAPSALVRRLAGLHPGYGITLRLAGLTQEDVLELLWDCRGRITHLELFNLHDWNAGKLAGLASISELRHALNSGDGPRLKRLAGLMADGMLRDAATAGRAPKFQHILRHLSVLWKRYARRPLKSRMGSGSASREPRGRMGLAFPASLPARARKSMRHRTVNTLSVPIWTELEERRSRFGAAAGKFAPLSVVRSWHARTDTARVSPSGNMVSLIGPAELPGLSGAGGNGFSGGGPSGRKKPPDIGYCNTALRNGVKVTAGFATASLTFLYTQQWWVLAWFGAWLWFAVTGVRNVMQMVLAGGGRTRGSLLRWHDHVDIGRICDSLLYTGISVLLLEAGIRVFLLEHLLGLGVREHPLLAFTVLNVVNGLYIAGHNVFRGFPRAASVGNLFRSVLAIPVSGFFNMTLVAALALAGVADPMQYVAACAAIVSKTASDVVAALIEGYADSRNNRRMRRWDYAGKLAQLRDCHARLELLLAEEKTELLVGRRGGLRGMGGRQGARIERTLIICALDLMYFWYYQPRAQEVFASLMRHMDQEKRMTTARLQLVLCRRLEIGGMLVDGGLVGRRFKAPLTFYLANSRGYLKEVFRLARAGRRGSPEEPGRDSGEMER